MLHFSNSPSGWIRNQLIARNRADDDIIAFLLLQKAPVSASLLLFIVNTAKKLNDWVTCVLYDKA